MKKTPAPFVAGLALATVLTFSSTAFAASVPTSLISSVSATYRVQKNDSLFKIAQKTGVSIDRLETLNGLKTTTLYPGHSLYLREARLHTTSSGDTLWKIAQKYRTTVSVLKELNNLTSDEIQIGQVLKIQEGAIIKTTEPTPAPNPTTKPTIPSTSPKPLPNVPKPVPKPIPSPTSTKPTNPPSNTQKPTPMPVSKPTPSTKPASEPVLSWPAKTYVVRAGDTVDKLAKQFQVSASNLLRYNYMSPTDWLDADDLIAVSGYAPRAYAVQPGQDKAPARVGKLVDWFLDGQYLLKRNDRFQITDVLTNKTLQVKMMGGYNHSDVEPLTTKDTAVLKDLFPGGWTWTPRAVVVYKDGMNIAASLSGMPHSFDSIPDNGVDGHIDLYLSNSKGHGSGVSLAYQKQHADMVKKAAGK
ncbi:LysM peptidoglycan-binding domain-containing protein [Heliobacterium mobile]|nr:LysM peptidoglycan-binding domain-containing protein [Heliobacterium mobile]